MLEATEKKLVQSSKPIRRSIGSKRSPERSGNFYVSVI